MISNTLVPPLYYPAKTSGSGKGRTCNTCSKLVPVESLSNNNDTITTTTAAATDPSVNAGGVKGLKVATNTNSDTVNI